MKKLIKKVLKPIKKLVRGVGGFFGKVMNKLGPLGMIGMMFAMPYLSNFWSSIGTTIGGTGVGGTAAAQAGAQASAAAVAEGTAVAGSSAAANIAAEAGKEAARQSLLQEGSGRLAARVASKYASGTGAPTGLFAGGTVSKALGYTLKTLHNVTSMSMNVFNTLTGAVSGAVDFISGGSLTKFGNWVGDRFGDFQTRMGMATGEGYKKRLTSRLEAGHVPENIVSVIKENNPNLFKNVEHLYDGNIHISNADTSTLISKDLPSFQEMREQGTLTADASRTPGPAPAPEDTVQVPDDTQQDISSLLEKQPTKEAAMAERDAYINILEKEGSLTALRDAERLRDADFSKWGTEGFAESMKPPSLLERFGERMGTFFKGGEQTQFNPIYERDAKGNIIYGSKGAIETGRYERAVREQPNFIERVTSKAGDIIEETPENVLEDQTSSWIDRKLGNVDETINKYYSTPSLPGLQYATQGDYTTTEIPRDNEFVTANNYNNLNNNIYASNPFAAIDPNKINIDYGQGGIYGS